VRSGGHVPPENVERDLPKAVDLAHKAGLSTLMIDTSLLDAKSNRVEAYLDTMRSVGIRLYKCSNLGRYDYSKDIFAQLEALKPQMRA